MKLAEIPQLSVGIMAAEEVVFRLNGHYSFQGKYYENAGGKARVCGVNLQVNCNGDTWEVVDEICFQAEEDTAFIELQDVTIGVGFHWERKENQQFRGNLKLICKEGKCLVINVITLENYLESVISSEMSATASVALLKAHAVISRSWLLAQLRQQKTKQNSPSEYRTDDELVKWYDREDHLYFDVCADDHCQRYQGITRVATEKAVQAVRDTAGEVLLYEDEVCDARFSKCCGGVVESFENVWEDTPKPYLIPLYDAENESLANFDLTKEKETQAFIGNSPQAFCNTKDAAILGEVLNDYDQETPHFFRWKIRYTEQELSELVKNRTGIDFGKIVALQPLERSYSGRIKRLKIIGEKRTFIVGKELEIRKTLSTSHLYSSAFVVERDGSDFVLKGAGWGHGVGLCQIGAAVMGAKGYSYTEILHHYFKNVTIERVY